MATNESNDSVLASRSMLAMESDPQWPDLLESFRNEYQPDTPSFEQHVQRAAQAELELREEERRYDEANRKWLTKAVTQWDDKQHKQERHMARRRDHAERIALRWSNVVERFRRARLVDRSRRALEKARNPEPKPNPFLAPVSLANVPYLQVVNVRVEHGVTITTCCPSNAEFLAVLRKVNLTGLKVQRQLNLPDRLPPEYQWAERSNGTHPGYIRWKMDEEEFATIAQREQEAGTEHIWDHMPLEEGDSKPLPPGTETVLYP